MELTGGHSQFAAPEPLSNRATGTTLPRLECFSDLQPFCRQSTSSGLVLTRAGRARPPSLKGEWGSRLSTVHGNDRPLARTDVETRHVSLFVFLEEIPNLTTAECFDRAP